MATLLKWGESWDGAELLYGEAWGDDASFALQPTAPIGISGTVGVQGDLSYIAPVRFYVEPLAPIGINGTVGVQGDPVSRRGFNLEQPFVLELAGTVGVQGDIAIEVAEPVVFDLEPQAPIGVSGTVGVQGNLAKKKALAVQDPIGVSGTVGVQGDVSYRAPFNIEPQAPIALAGEIGIQGDVSFDVRVVFDVEQSAPIALAGELAVSGDLEIRRKEPAVAIVTATESPDTCAATGLVEVIATADVVERPDRCYARALNSAWVPPAGLNPLIRARRRGLR